MKKIFVIILLIQLLASCSNSTKNPTLVEVDKMMNSNPDSAYSILKRVAKDTASYSTTNQMYFKLLQAEAMNKNEISMAKIADMDDVIKYYSSYGTQNEQAKSLYMMGCVYRDRGNSPLAILYYNRALSTLGTKRNNCDFYLASRIYGQMTEIYSKQRCPQLEQQMNDSAAYYSLKAKDTINYLICKELTGSALYKQGQYEKVKQIAQNAYSFYKKIRREDLAASSLAPLMGYYLKDKQYKKAKESLDEYREKSDLLDKMGEPASLGAEYFYYYLGWYYKDMGKTDSALYCYRKLLNYSNDLIDIEGGYEGLMLTYHCLENVDSVKKYNKLYIHANETSYVKLSAQEVSKTQASYDYTYHQQQASKAATENFLLWKILFVVLSAICSLTILTYIWRKINLNEKLGLLLKYQKKEKELASAKKKAKQKEQSLAQENTYLKEVISIYQKLNRKEEHEAEKELMSSDIVKKFLNYQKACFIPSENDWLQLETAFIDFLPNFYQKLAEYKLTNHQFRLCLLTRISFMPSDIANLFEVKIQQVTNLRSNVNQKLFNKKGTTRFEMNIKNM